MPNFEVDVDFMDRVTETVPMLDMEDKDEAEFAALNFIRDRYPDSSNLEILDVREIV